jgi:two-component system, NtrC family, sensor kinase
MRPLLIIILCFCINCSSGQDAMVLSPAMFTGVGEITICMMDGWYFKEGHDTAWAQKEIDVTGWEKLKPTELSVEQTDKNGRLEGWLRFKFKLDDGFRNSTPGLLFNGWAAADIYIDGKLIRSFGNSGVDKKTFREFNSTYQLPFYTSLQTGVEHTIAMHFTDYAATVSPYKLMSNFNLHRLLLLTDSTFYSERLKIKSQSPVYKTLWMSVAIVLTLLFCLLAFLNPRERELRLFAICSAAITLAILLNNSFVNSGNSFVAATLFHKSVILAYTVSGAISIIVVAQVFKTNLSTKIKIALGVYILAGIAHMIFNNDLLWIALSLIPIVLYSYFIVSSWKILKGAQWAIVGGLFGAMSFSLLYNVLIVKFKSNFFPGNLLLTTGIMLSFPVSLLVYVALRVREIIRDVQQNAQRVMQLSEERKDQAIRQQKLLEEEVSRQTKELRTSFENLKSTQAQLIQSEKMASLGELTAGIAHEIQNPLNFVNNFSEVNKELLIEMKEELENGNVDEVKAIANDVIANQEKINHHGKRADAIVKGMLQHSRSSSSVKELTDVNALVDEYTRLCYHGLRAKDKSFKATITTDFDRSIGKINIVPQDIGRVVLNLLTNAFYAVNECALSAVATPAGLNKYEPTVSISTKNINEKVEISIADNGHGIPQKVLDKIFQPFFTTKPTGQGTGLGLSLSYDIVKAHAGEIIVHNREGEGTEFIIELPIIWKA